MVTEYPDYQPSGNFVAVDDTHDFCDACFILWSHAHRYHRDEYDSIMTRDLLDELLDDALFESSRCPLNPRPDQLRSWAAEPLWSPPPEPLQPHELRRVRVVSTMRPDVYVDTMIWVPTET